jgi:hypothetical protein
MNDVTFIFTVGGQSCHYDNMERCIRSIEKKYSNSKFLILEFGNRLKTSENKKVVNLENVINFEAGKKVGFIIWKHKYVGALMIETKYGVYVDTDTVLLNDTLPDIINNIDGGFVVTPHFWVPNIQHYQHKATDRSSIDEFIKIKSMLRLEDQDLFFAGGVFVFENNENTRSILKEVLRMYDEYYTGKDYVKSITDELFLAAALNKRPELIRLCGGALNHCSMGDENMPMIEKDGILYGKNSFESMWQPITFLHCDISRRDPSEKYNGQIRDTIRKAFEMN